VVRADERHLAIRPRSGPEVTLRLGPGTALRAGGRRSGPEALRPGVEVRASYRTVEDGPAAAASVDVIAPAPARPTPVIAPAPPASPPPVITPAQPAQPASPAPEAEPFGTDHG
jgi:hypothetical protein